MEELCPDCGGDDIGCPFGDWSWGEVDTEGEPGTGASASRPVG